MTLEMRDEIMADPDVLQFLLMHGALPLSETWIKKRAKAQPDEPPRAEQLTMQWPVKVRPIVEQIDRDALFVPSRDEYVQLLPDHITKPELLEAAEHLQLHAEDTMRIVNLIKRLVREL